ncbi:uncharacterized protein LOC111057302 isoform X2 [Nilaparvata lugens]|nr:uncharacterized protein LOC111057302 isoform X2 [Nilaparvata lugens]
MGPLSTKHDNDQSCDPGSPLDKKNSGNIFYAIYIPEPNKADKYQTKIFHDKLEALTLVKSDKRARFKVCSTLAEAMTFSKDGGGGGGHGVTSQQQSSSLSVEKSAFSGPKSTDLVRMRKAIEAGDLETVRKTVWDNPRYLVSSGDTPSILQEGSRYNALHVCARTQQAAICAFILQTVGSVEFVRLLYGSSTSNHTSDADERCRVLVDLYLNTPDKGHNETPLHFAAKHGAAEVVEVLVAHAQCDKTRVNKYGQTASEIICTRSNDKSEGLSRRIRALLDEHYFVPVLRSSDPTVEPSIGQPFSPSSPLNLSGDIMSPVKEIQGLAGPMPLDVAKAFRKNWKTPPRDPQSPLRKVIQDPMKGLENIGRRLAQDCNIPWKEYWPFLDMFADFHSQEGLNLLENYLADRISIADGISIHNRSNREKSSQCSTPASKPSQSLFNNHVINNNNNYNNSTPNCRLSSDNCSGNKMSRDPLTSDKFVCEKMSPNDGSDRSSVLSPMSELCVAMKSCRLTENSRAASRQASPLISDMAAGATAAQQIGNCGLSPRVDCESPVPPPLSVHLCIEKSCQVFAKRIIDNLLMCSSSGAEMLASEATHMHTLISSFLVDDRFAAVNFAHLHDRIAKCILHKLDASDLPEFNSAVRAVRLKQMEESESSSSEDESALMSTPYRSASRRLFSAAAASRKRKMRDHVVCLTSTILACLTEEERRRGTAEMGEEGEEGEGGVGAGGGQLPSTEEECSIAWQSAVPCLCNWTVTDSKRLSWRNRSFFNNMDARRECRCSEGDTNSVPESNNGLSKTSSDDDSDNSDAENREFYTPPSSPGSSRLVTSDEDMSMESPDEGPDIFIYSDGPTYLDKAVYEAIDRDKLDSSKYPFICRWVHFISLFSNETRERWGQPKRSPNGQHPYINSPSSMNSSFDSYSPCRATNLRTIRKPAANFASKRLLF